MIILQNQWKWGGGISVIDLSFIDDPFMGVGIGLTLFGFGIGITTG